jgi:hypothetical protein
MLFDLLGPWIPRSRVPTCLRPIQPDLLPTVDPEVVIVICFVRASFERVKNWLVMHFLR